MTPNFGGKKNVIESGVEPKLLCEGVWNTNNHSSHSHAIVETRRLELTRKISFKIRFFYSGVRNYFQRLATYRKNKSSLAWK